MKSHKLDEKPIKDVTNRHNNDEQYRNIVSFFVFGGITHGQSAVLSSAVQDILAGTLLPTTTLHLTKSLPRVLVTIFYPWYVAFIPPILRVLLAVVATATGILLVVYSREVHVKLIGVAMFSVGFGAAEVALTGLAAFYHPITMAVYQTGNGFFSAFSPLVYVGKSTVGEYLFYIFHIALA